MAGAAWDELRALLSRSALAAGPGLPAAGGSVEAGAAKTLSDRALPPQLLEWLAIANGSYLGQGGLFGIGTADEHLDIAFHQALYPDWRAKEWIPVAGDGCGNYYVLLADHARDGAEGAPVLFVDTSDDSGAGNYLVASSLVRFLRFYLEATIERTGWPFDKAYLLARDPAILDVGVLILPWDDVA